MDKAIPGCYTQAPKMRQRVLGLLVVCAAVLAACGTPKYVHYRSVSGDFGAYVPWGWNVIAEAENDAFSEVKFLGPFDVDFFLGTPSLSVRWYKRYRAHKLRDGRIEMYSDADDFVKQMLRQVYGSDAVLLAGGRAFGTGDAHPARALLEAGKPVPEIPLPEGADLPVKYFAVLSRADAPAGAIGAVKDVDGNWHNLRLHEYAVVTMPSGFYVISYPATERGHDKGLDRFNKLAATFHPYTDGPGGPKISLRPVSVAKKP